jgi:hypothetical protein
MTTEASKSAGQIQHEIEGRLGEIAQAIEAENNEITVMQDAIDSRKQLIAAMRAEGKSLEKVIRILKEG